MSDTTPQKGPRALALEQQARIESELALKKKELDRALTEERHRDYKVSQEKLEKLSNIVIGEEGEQYTQALLNKNQAYFAAAKKAITFVTQDFKGMVPFFPGNLFLIGAKTGEGKSTLSANLCFSGIKQGKRTLVISTEEQDIAIYNRITSMIKGINYANHENFTPEELAKFQETLPLLRKRVSVIDNNYLDLPNATTTYESLTTLMDSLLKPGAPKFDQIIIDYIQKITGTDKVKKDQDWVTLSKVMNYLDNFKDKYEAPIVVLSQLWPNKDEEIDFESRIKGYKGILVPVTCAIEVKPNKKEYKTSWIVHKNRWQGEDSENKVVETGWHKGKFVSMNDPEYLTWKTKQQSDRIMRINQKENSNGNSANIPRIGSSNGNPLDSDT